MNELSEIENKLSTPVSTANAFAAAGSELGDSALPILKLAKSGNWIFGTENTPVSETRFAADVRGSQRGFVCFIDGEVVGEVMVPVALGKVISPDELPDHGPYEGTDGWKPSASIQLRSTETGEQFVFKPTSQGGHAAIGALLTKYGYRLGLGKGGIPIVDLDVTSYEHKRYGTVFKPVFKIVSWQNEAALVPGAGEDLGEDLLNDSVPF